MKISMVTALTSVYGVVGQVSREKSESEKGTSIRANEGENIENKKAKQKVRKQNSETKIAYHKMGE